VGTRAQDNRADIKIAQRAVGAAVAAERKLEEASVGGAVAKQIEKIEAG
jgi:hypothetical protein